MKDLTQSRRVAENGNVAFLLFVTCITLFSAQRSPDYLAYMLRYDSAVPRDGAAVEVIARSPDRVGPRTTDTVRLRSYNPAGPTIGRWNSFGWLVLDIEKER